MKMNLQVAAQTDVGIVRHNNEDGYAFDTRLGVFVLCDGMGGQAAGEVACSLGLDSVTKYFRDRVAKRIIPAVGTPNQDLSEIGNAVLTSIRLANLAICEAASRDSERSGMGSTIVVAFVCDNMIAIGNVGDSRGYILRNRKLEQLTIDHSLVAEQVRRGHLTQQEAQDSPMQNILLRALGHEQSVEADVRELVAIEDDLFLLVCDGITKVISDDVIEAILVSQPSLNAAAAALIETAKQNNSDDNLTCVLLRFVRRPWYSLMQARHSGRSR